jgi:serine/threonine protein kinase
VSLADYELLESLGSGGQGRTFRGRQRAGGRAVAIKVLQLKGAEGWKPFDLFERECAVLKSLDHPSIPRFVASFADERAGKFYLVMDLVDGTTLQQVLRQRETQSEAQLWSIFHQALDILDYLHGRSPPVIHRDVKPANLIRRPDQRLALVDFGGVRLALRPDGGSTVIGTFGYMAPEQLHGEATAATDIFALAATIAALATGIEADKLPRRGLQVDLASVLSPGKLQEVLSRMLAPDPAARLPNVRAVRAMLAEDLPGDERRPWYRFWGRGSEATEATASQSSPAISRGPTQPDPKRALSVTPVPAPAHPADEFPLPFPLSLVVRLLGVVGYVGLVVLDAIILPLVYAIVSMVAKDPSRVRRIGQRIRTLRDALKEGEFAMKKLAATPTSKRVRGRDLRRRKHQIRQQLRKDRQLAAIHKREEARNRALEERQRRLANRQRGRR